MKTINGTEASRHIKGSYPEAKIIVVTDFGDKMLKSAAESAGVYAYVLKEKLFDIYKIIKN